MVGLAALGGGLMPTTARAASQPDFMLGGSAPASILHGKVFTFTVKLHNDAAVGASKPSVMGTLHRNFQILSVAPTDPHFTCQFWNDDFVFGELWACASTTPMAPQGTMIAKITVRAPATAGAHTIQNGADPNNLVVESDETNNDLNWPIQIT